MAATLTDVRHELPTTDRERLVELEAVVDRGLRTFVEVGLALATIRDEHLYRATHSSFKAYLRERWNFDQPFAYNRIYAAQVAVAISAEHGSLPAGISLEAMRALVPLLNRDGPDAVARAWGQVMERHGARPRPPSREQVRAVLVAQGLPTCAPERARLPETGQIGISLERAMVRVARVRAKLDGKLLAPPARQRLTEWATLARVLAEELDALADGRRVAARLAAAEADGFCERHGHVRDGAGRCRWCGRMDGPASFQ